MAPASPCASPSATPSPPSTCPCPPRRRTSRLKTTWPEVCPAAVVCPLTPPAQKILRELKSKISSQSKKNFVLEKDVRYLDSRIALLIQNRMALEEVRPLPFTTHAQF